MPRHIAALASLATRATRTSPTSRSTPWRAASRLAAAVLACGLAGAIATPAQAAGPQRLRLQIEADLQREAALSGVERGRLQLAQRVQLQLVLATDGALSVSNPLDPDDSRRMAEQAQRTQAKVQAALQRQGQAPAGPDPQQLMAQAQALMARCGQDRDCLMREASAMSAARVAAGNPQVQARLQAYGDAVRACERQHAASAAREACIARARQQAGGSDESDADDAVEAPYLVYTASAASCQLDAATRIDARTEGSFDDVQGVVPFTSTTRADGRERDAMLCPLMMAVLDTRNGRLWTRVLPALRGVPGTTVRAERGRRPQQSEAVQPASWYEAQDWLTERLGRLNSQGSDRLERALPGGKLELKLRWSATPA